MVGAAVGLVTGGISAALNGGNILQGMLQGAFNGAVDGFMWGGITAGLTNIVKPGMLCFAAGTKVLAENGQRNIEDIKVGDRVLAYNEQTGEQEYKKVVRLFRNESKDWTGITVNGEEIISTPGHKYYIPESKKWVSAKELKKGNIVLLSNGERTEVESVRSIHYEEAHTTYNFEVEDFHTYYVGAGVLVHNIGCNNPYGKKGGPAHQGKINELEKFYTSKGYSVGREASIKTPGGFKSTRFADLAVSKGGETFYVQVGRATKSGLPVIREMRAMQDIINSGKKVIFFAYNILL